MENEAVLEKYGLFRAKVPRFTSYPPANFFAPTLGGAHQLEWLSALDPNDPVSLYIHVPFCKRLCWFCACRTQGTKTLRPVAAYVETLLREIREVRRHLPAGLRMARLHLGGGTPTLMNGPMTDQILGLVFENFPKTEDFEFSIEVDPTEAEEELLAALASWGLTRASIGVQDFDPRVQKAIGRFQGPEITGEVISRLRDLGVESLNIDLLYGLPHQTEPSLARTLAQVLEFAPDRLALYGYAHVPNISRRQVMIDDAALPGTRARHALAMAARKRLLARTYREIGIDHFARPGDSLTQAHDAGRLRRNFQGYTDDPCATLIGFGASAISRFRGGYCQNAVATAAYLERVGANGLAGDRGFVMSPHDRLFAAMIEDLMCRFELDRNDLCRRFPEDIALIASSIDALLSRFPDALSYRAERLTIRKRARSLCRIIAAALSQYGSAKKTGSLAI